MLQGYLDLPTFTFFAEKNIWTGSVFQEFNYRIFLKTTDDTKNLCAIVWLGKMCFDKVDPTEYICEILEEFSPAGLEILIADLNGRADEYKRNNS